MSTTNQNICVAKILSPHGIKGGVKVKSYMETPIALFDLSGLMDEHGQSFHLKKYGGHSDVFNAMIDGIDTRDGAEGLKGTLLYVSKDAFDALDADTFYYDDLVGLSVKSGDEVIGTVSSVLNFGAGDVLEIKMVDGAKKMISFQGDAVKDVDTKQGVIQIDDTHLL